jgi:hypothetical protein
LDQNDLDENDYPFDDFRRENTEEMIENYLYPKKKEGDKAPKPTKMLSQALLQRRECSKEFNLSNKVLFDIFSQFKSMMTMAQHEPAEGTIPKNSVLPVEPHEKMTSVNLKKIMDRINNKDEAEKREAAKSLHPNGLDIPVKTFKNSWKPFKYQKPELVDKILHALGVEAQTPNCRVSWETFL